MFHLLAHLDPKLPDFSIKCWPSTMRKHAALHPEYADITDWQGDETADIVYHDEEGVLTQRLIEKGYLNEREWTGKTPLFNIEVKATTDTSETPCKISVFQRNMVCRYLTFFTLCIMHLFLPIRRRMGALS